MFSIAKRAQLITALIVIKIAMSATQADNVSEQTSDANVSSGTEVDANNDGVDAIPDGFKTSFHLASEFFGLIIGSKFSTKKRIEGQTRTTIKIPRAPNENIEIVGKERENVRRARDKIKAILRVNHFTGVRISNEDIKVKYGQFMEELLHGPPVDGLTEAMFMRPIKLHITINVMTLLDDHDMARATQLLNDCVEKVILPAKNQFGQIAVNVSGVGIFADENPSTVRVLFGRIESEPLQQVADGITEYFIADGATKRERGRTSVKLHMTLINTRFDKEKDEKDGNGNAMPRRHRKPKTFDATTILEKYADYEFGSQEVTEILLSSMAESDSDGFYKTIASVQF